MAEIRVKNKLTGQTGTLSEEYFNPNKYDRIEEATPTVIEEAMPTVAEPSPYGLPPSPKPNTRSKLLNLLMSSNIQPMPGGMQTGYNPSTPPTPRFVEKMIEDPTTATITGSVLGNILLGKPGGILGAGGFSALSSIGRGEGIKQVGTEATKGVGAELAGLGVGAAGTKILGKALAKTPLYKLFTPGLLKKNIEQQLVKVGKELDDILTEASTRGEVVKIAPIVQDLIALRDKWAKKLVPRAVEKIEQTIQRIQTYGPTPSISDISAIKMGFWDEIFGQAGKELKKRGAGKAEVIAKELAGGGISGAVRGKVPEAIPVMDLYSALGETSKGLEQPLSKWWLGGLAGSLGLTAAAGPVVGAVPTITSLLAMPYSRAVIRKLVGEILKASEYPVKAGVRSLEDFIFGKNEKRK